MKPSFLALVLMVVAVSDSAHASAPSVCVVVATEPATEGLDDASLATAWALETRKRGLAFRLEVVRLANECTQGSRLLAFIDAQGRLSLGDTSPTAPGDPQSVAAVALLEFEPWERSSEVSRVLAGALTLSDDASNPLGSVQEYTPKEAASLGPPIRLGVEIGGVYLPQPGPGSHRGAAELAIGVGLMEQRQLTLALRATWQPPQQLVGAASPTMWDSVEVGLDVQLRFPMARWAVGLGMQLGAEFRSVEVNDPSRQSPITASDVGFVATVTALASYELIDDLHLSLVAGVRVQVDRTAYAWLGDPLYTGPLATGVVGLRMAWWFL